MNLANLFNLTNVEMGFIFVEISILLSVYLTYRYFKRITAHRVDKRHPLLDSNQLKKCLQESEAVCQGLSRNLKEKREIAQQLIEQLDAKIEILESLLKRADREGLSLSQGVKEKNLEAQILEMAEAGVDISDIARQLQISKGEVQLTLDLKRYCQ
jgi:hypothetical protein